MLNLSKRWKIYFSAFLILLLVALFAFVTFFVVTSVYYPKYDFNQSRWLNNPRTRYELADDLIESEILIGKNKAEVKKLLGNEEGKDEDYGGYRIQNSETSDEWEYFIGFKPAPMRREASFLEIKFRNGKVFRAYVASQ